MGESLTVPRHLIVALTPALSPAPPKHERIDDLSRNASGGTQDLDPDNLHDEAITAKQNWAASRLQAKYVLVRIYAPVRQIIALPTSRLILSTNAEHL